MRVPHPGARRRYISSGATSSVTARSTASESNTPLTASTNSHPYSCRNHKSPIVRRSSSRNAFGIRGHSSAGTRTISHPLFDPARGAASSFPPARSAPPALGPCARRDAASHVSQKNPLFPNGVLISQSVPLLTASIGRSERYSSSLTRDASSTSSSPTAENPRTVASLPDRKSTRLNSSHGYISYA